MSKNKKKEIIVETNPEPSLPEKLGAIASGVVNAEGVIDVLILGLKDNDKIEIGTSFNNYEQIHTILSRTAFEINMAHAKAVIAANEVKEEK